MHPLLLPCVAMQTVRGPHASIPANASSKSTHATFVMFPIVSIMWPEKFRKGMPMVVIWLCATLIQPHVRGAPPMNTSHSDSGVVMLMHMLIAESVDCH